MRLTIQCEPFGKPATAAGPKARAVFMAAPVYGTANLNNPFHLSRQLEKAVIFMLGKPEGPALEGFPGSDGPRTTQTTHR
jgi:hypothetical protein